MFDKVSRESLGCCLIQTVSAAQGLVLATFGCFRSSSSSLFACLYLWTLGLPRPPVGLCLAPSPAAAAEDEDDYKDGNDSQSDLPSFATVSEAEEQENASFSSLLRFNS